MMSVDASKVCAVLNVSSTRHVWYINRVAQSALCVASIGQHRRHADCPIVPIRILMFVETELTSVCKRTNLRSSSMRRVSFLFSAWFVLYKNTHITQRDDHAIRSTSYRR